MNPPVLAVLADTPCVFAVLESSLSTAETKGESRPERTFVAVAVPGDSLYIKQPAVTTFPAEHPAMEWYRKHLQLRLAPFRVIIVALQFVKFLKDKTRNFLSINSITRAPCVNKDEHDDNKYNGKMENNDYFSSRAEQHQRQEYTVEQNIDCFDTDDGT